MSVDGSDSGEKVSLIEDFGVHIGGAMGWPPMAGRAAGVLMLSEAPMTMSQLQDALDASKGSVSETTRLLITTGTVERFKEPGSRQFVYRWRDDAWIGCLQHQLEQTTELLALAESAQIRGSTLPSEQRARFHAMHEYYSFMVSRLEMLLTEYTSQFGAGQ
ncbi:GbsR/MarR family transcriptional regulator [Rhodococcus sp. NPDC059968]|uniref:GbsR/MarR family transcriptional regulator n=1 Tax=Rhodococcus sp. NPDC059968 TaxID=3347017 RepID=UPI0036704C74